MDYFRIFLTLIGVAVICWFGYSDLSDWGRISAPSQFNQGELPMSAISETGGSTMYQADALRGNIPTGDPSVRIGS